MPERFEFNFFSYDKGTRMRASCGTPRDVPHAGYEPSRHLFIWCFGALCETHGVAPRTLNSYFALRDKLRMSFPDSPHRAAETHAQVTSPHGTCSQQRVRNLCITGRWRAGEIKALFGRMILSCNYFNFFLSLSNIFRLFI